jgi:TonB family protein
MVRQTISSCIMTLAIAVPCTVAATQNHPRVAQNSNGACESNPKQELNRPDIFSPDYVPTPAGPDPDAATAPQVVYSVDPQFPDDAPKGDFSGITKVALLIEADGKPQQVHVEQSLGPGFDKTAVAAVQQYRFKPAQQHGKPVTVKVCVEVNYRK